MCFLKKELRLIPVILSKGLKFSATSPREISEFELQRLKGRSPIKQFVLYTDSTAFRRGDGARFELKRNS